MDLEDGQGHQGTAAGAAAGELQVPHASVEWLLLSQLVSESSKTSRVPSDGLFFGARNGDPERWGDYFGVQSGQIYGPRLVGGCNAIKLISRLQTIRFALFRVDWTPSSTYDATKLHTDPRVNRSDRVTNHAGISIVLCWPT